VVWLHEAGWGLLVKAVVRSVVVESGLDGHVPHYFILVPAWSKNSDLRLSPL
jgi:hypothetical protein